MLCTHTKIGRRTHMHSKWARRGSATAAVATVAVDA